MDNPLRHPPADTEGVDQTEYAPKVAAVVAAWAGAVTAVAWSLLTADPAGRVLALAAVAVLGVLAITGTVIRPRLAVGLDGLSVNGFAGERQYPWLAVQRVEVVRTHRLGRRVGMLEIEALDPDGSERLLVMTGLDLGADPYEVADEIERLRGRPSR